MLEVQSSVEKGVPVLHLIGELDIVGVGEFKKGVEEAAEGAASLIIDMTRLGFVDSTGVGGLLNVVKRLKNNKVDIRMRNISCEVFEVFDLLGLPMLLGKETFE